MSESKEKKEKKEEKYQRGKIYKITCMKTREIYIGSTIEKVLTTRLSKEYHDRKRKSSVLCQMMNKYGKDSFKIELVKDFPCSTRKELRREEQKMIQKYKPQINQMKSFVDHDK